MAELSPIWNAFNAGELSPLLDGRTDQEKYFTGCKVMQNFIPTVQGPASRRGGTRFLGETKDSERAWLLSFEFSQEQSYVLEFGDLYARFWVNRGQLQDGPDPYEIVTPWSSSELITTDGTFALRTVQSGDIMWICQQAGTEPPHKLSRLGATNWSLAEVPFLNGPFNDVNPDSGATVQCSVTAKGSPGALTSSGFTFLPSDVGTSFYLENPRISASPTWKVDVTAVVGDIWRYEGNVYIAESVGTTGKTGAAPPVHIDGVETDGPDNVAWRYLHSNYGIFRITAYVNPAEVTGYAVTNIPATVSASPTNRFARAVFNATDGWPTAVAFFRERLFYSRGRTVCGSVVGAFDDFSRYEGPDVTKETALKLTLASDRVDALLWLVGARTLLAGSSRAEVSIQEQTTQQVFAADNATNIPQTEYGSRLLEPLRAGGSVLFVQRSGRKMRELRYDYANDAYGADELTVLSEHILNAGVIDMDFAQEPDSIVWCVLADGTLAALTYNRDRGVVAWAPHYIGAPGMSVTAAGGVSGHGIVESVASIASPDGTRDDVWLSVRRTINGETKRYIEFMEDNRLAQAKLADAFYLDAGITRPDGAPTFVVSGLDHLEGATVQILADGNPHADRVVDEGQITLDFPARVIHVGFNAPARLKTMRVDVGVQGGTAQSKMKSLSEVYLRLDATLGGRAGPDFDRLDGLTFSDPLAPIGAPLTLFSGDKEITWPATYDTEGYVCIVQDQPLPMTLVAIIGRLDLSEQ